MFGCAIVQPSDVFLCLCSPGSLLCFRVAVVTSSCFIVYCTYPKRIYLFSLSLPSKTERHNIQVPHGVPGDPSVTFRRSASSRASNFCCSAKRSATGSWDMDPSIRSFPALSDFGLLAFCRSSSHEDRVAKFRACSARISSQRLLS